MNNEIYYLSYTSKVGAEFSEAWINDRPYIGLELSKHPTLPSANQYSRELDDLMSVDGAPEIKISMEIFSC